MKIHALLLPFFLLTACESEIDGKTAAEVRDVPAAPAAPAAAPAAPAAPAEAPAGVEVSFSNEGSSLEWVGAKVSGDHKGGFQRFSGTARVDGDQVLGATVEIDVTSLFSDTEKLTGHLKSPDFFDIERMPKASFETTSITAGGEGGTHTVTGVLDLLGAKKELSFPATIAPVEGGHSVKAEFTLNRKTWGLVYPGKPDDLIKDEVLVRLDVKLPKAG